MSDVTFARRLVHTPLRDAIRGRLTARLDWRGHIIASGLPVVAQALIARVVRRTRLWRLEKSNVADELIAHFADAAAAGESTESAIVAFGDERQAARLIRRATIRKRPLAWHAMKWTRRGIALLVAVYAMLFARFMLSRPTVSVDYVAKLNAPILATPESDRAWPLYRRAILALQLDDRRRQDALPDQPWTHPLDEPMPESDIAAADYRLLIDATPADIAWPRLTAWLDANVDGLALLRAAAAKPAMGFVLGPAGSQFDPELGWQSPISELDPSKPMPVIEVLLPALNHMRKLATVLAADVRYAAASNDGERAAANLEAMLGIARHQSDPLIITRLVGISVVTVAFDAIERTLSAHPDLFTDAQCVRLAHAVATYGGEVPGSLIDLTGERIFFYDILQRVYSDDGDGKGRLTPEGVRLLAEMTSSQSTGIKADVVDRAARMALGGVNSAIGSREKARLEYDRLMDFTQRLLDRPLRDALEGADTVIERRLAEIQEQPFLKANYLPIALLLPSLNRAAWTAEQVLGRREGVTVGIALELYRRRHGSYPETLDALVPALLPRVPADRITGAPIRYRLIEGRPVVYSVGVDRDDDGGRAAIGRLPKAMPSLAAAWPAVSGETPSFDGDWILYDARR